MSCSDFSYTHRTVALVWTGKLSARVLDVALQFWQRKGEEI